MDSAIYVGRVRHRRFEPVEHEFRHELFLLYLDLGELDRVFRDGWGWSASRPALAWLRREDHLGDPAVPLEVAVRDLVEERTGARPAGPIRLLTHLRYFGYTFNPVSFYYCFAPDGGEVETVVAEVNNTPWGEQHPYVLDRPRREGPGRLLRYDARKEFHVSPFLDLDMNYEIVLSPPDEHLRVAFTNLVDGRRVFDAHLAMRREEITARSLRRMLIRYPFMTQKVIAAIHWQALKLWWKGATFYPHPKHRREAVPEEMTR